MQASMLKKLETLKQRFDELQALLSQEAVITDQNRFRELSKEFAKLEPVVDCYQRYQKTQTDMSDSEALMTESDPEMKALAYEELKATQKQQQLLELELKKLLIPEDPNDALNVFLEIRAGAGGDEASIFAGDLFRMYQRYAENNRWKMEILSSSEGEHGGFKQIIVKLIGDKVYSKLKFESGAHRVQRVPATESQGRVHTSTCTVAILPEPEAIDNVEINPQDLRIDTFRSSGAGGQHVNTTDSAIRITHLPTGTVVECQDERSQHKNKARALSLLQARLLADERNRQIAKQTAERRNLVGSGDRSERIRTYNFPQGRMTDHRINLTLYKLDDIMQGDLNHLIEPLVQEHQADQMAALGDE